MLLLYRADWLRRIVADQGNRRFMERQGYPADADLPQLLERLADRLCLEEDYPHEIGLFLGYPLEDVVGFIENRGRNFTCCGYWKAYGDPAAARRRPKAGRRRKTPGRSCGPVRRPNKKAQGCAPSRRLRPQRGEPKDRAARRASSHSCGAARLARKKPAHCAGVRCSLRHNLRPGGTGRRSPAGGSRD
jgi:hypothetical protein